MDRQIDEWTISVIYVPSNVKLTGIERFIIGTAENQKNILILLKDYYSIPLITCFIQRDKLH